MGDAIAREVEIKLGLPRGWVDQIHLDLVHNLPPPDRGGKITAPFADASPMMMPPFMEWQKVTAHATLPATFMVKMPDEALTPGTPMGTMLIFDTNTPPAFGQGVLVQDAAGRHFIRRFAESSGSGWAAVARNDAYRSLESVRDGLRVLAVVTGRLDGMV